MITPAVDTLHIYRANDFSYVFDIDIDDTILNLSGASVFAQIRFSNYLEAELIIDLTTGVSTGAESGYDSDITLSLTDAQTATLDVGTYWFDVLVVDGAGVDTTYLQGPAIVHHTTTVKA